MDDAAAQRKVFLVRLAAWGTVLVLAVVAFNVRAGASGQRTDQGANGTQVNGETSQEIPIWAVVGDGHVREIRMAWNFDCDNDGELEPFGVTLRDSVDGFEWSGRRFKFEGERDLPRSEDGWETHASVKVSGRTSENGSTGESEAILTFSRGSERDVICRSGAVTWSVGRLSRSGPARTGRRSSP